MIEQARQVLRRKPLTGVVISMAVHAVLLLALVGVNPARTPVQKRGDALIVELRDLDESGGRGTPGPQADAPLTPAPPAPAPAPKAPPTPKAPPVRPTPPAPVRPPAAARTAPAPKAEPRETPRAVAAAPQPPPAAERGDMPAAKSAPQAPLDAATPPAAKPESETPPSPPGQVAMVPPTAPDIRSAFRRGGGGGGTGPGGAGGIGTGRGGIVGESLPLDSKEGDLQDYFERIRRLIKQNWVYPCIKNRGTNVCEYKSAVLVVEFGILKPGPLQYVEVRQASPWGIYDEFAMNAIKLASPFPPVPPAVMARMGRGSNGASILVRFVYVYESGITNVLR